MFTKTSILDVRNGGRAEIIDDGDTADLTDLADIPHGDNTGHDREEDDRSDNELDKIQEDRSEGLDVSGCEFRMGLHEKTRDDSQDQCDKDLGGK